MATLPTWVKRGPILLDDTPTDIEWDDGYPASIQRRYQIEIEIPANVTDRHKWLVDNIESAAFTAAAVVTPFAGIPVAGDIHSETYSGLFVRRHHIAYPGARGNRVVVTVTYERPDAPQQTTNNGRQPVPYGSWSVVTGWTTAKLMGADYRGQPIMTKAGEAVNVQCNVAVFTLSKSSKVNGTAVAEPSINANAVSVAGFIIPKHCGLMVQSNVENNDSDKATYARVLTTQVMYIPRAINVASGTIVNPSGSITSLTDVGSFDVLTLHQGYRELSDGKVVNVGFHDKTIGKRATFHALSVLDATGAHVEPDAQGIVTPYYLAFQVYPDASWTNL